MVSLNEDAYNIVFCNPSFTYILFFDHLLISVTIVSHSLSPLTLLLRIESYHKLYRYPYSQVHFFVFISFINNNNNNFHLI